jgi:hypothetical protein
VAQVKRRQVSRHDRAVKNAAAQYAALGYEVQADIPGYAQPLIYNGRRPDLVAMGFGETILKEFETPGSDRTHREQHRDLRAYARQHCGVRFIKKTVR